MGKHDLAVFGDWHMRSAWATHMFSAVADATTGRNWYHVGDFGLWSTQSHSEGRAYLDAVESALASVGATLHVVLGNHENYDLRDDFVPAEAGWFGLPGWDRIRFAPRAHVWTHPDTDVAMAALGGAGSIDVAAAGQRLVAAGTHHRQRRRGLRGAHTARRGGRVLVA